MVSNTGTRVLIAEDDKIARRVLEAALVKWGYKVVVACDGKEAWELITAPDSPNLLILDWMMPGIDGVDLCRKIRSLDENIPKYVILLTALSDKKGVVWGLEAGANDYITKPFDNDELRARVKVGQLVVELQSVLADNVKKLELEIKNRQLAEEAREKLVEELQEALARVKRLSGLLPICASCKRIRDDKGYWNQVEEYIRDHSEARFSHSLCKECAKEFLS